MPYRLDLAALRPRELKRALPPGSYLVARPALAAARLLRRQVLGPDEFPDRVELVPTVEEDWDGLGASVGQALEARAMRDALRELGAEQVGAYRLPNLPYARNLFAYAKTPDVFAALYLTDAAGVGPYLEFYSLFRAERDGKLGLVSSNSPAPDPLDPSARLVWQVVPGASVDALFQAHRGRLLELGKANRKAATAQDFERAFTDLAGENYAAWLGRGVLRPAPVSR